MKEKTKLKTIEEIPLEELESQISVEDWFVIIFAGIDMWHFFIFQGAEETESIIPQWFFKTSIRTEPERIEF